MSFITRRQLAKYTAGQLAAGRASVIDELAAYLVHERRVKEVGLLVRDIEAALTGHGIGVAHIAAARSFDEVLRARLSELLKRELGTDEIVIDEAINPELLGGFTVSAAGKELDASLVRKINRLKMMKV